MANKTISTIVQENGKSDIFRARFARFVYDVQSLRVWIYAPNGALVTGRVEVSEPDKNEWILLTDAVNGEVVEFTSSNTAHIETSSDLDVRWDISNVNVTTPVDPATLDDPDDITQYPAGSVRIGIAHS